MIEEMPTKLEIGYKSVDVIKQANSSGALGLANDIAGKIVVKTSDHHGVEISEIEQADTLVHEILHIIWRQRDVDPDEDIEERAVSQLAHGLIELFRRNPQALKYLERACAS